MKAIQLEAFGNPAEVLKLVDVPDVGTPAAGEVVIALEASPINMSDLLMISGRYGYRPELPCVMGAEGVGRVRPGRRGRRSRPRQRRGGSALLARVDDLDRVGP